MLIAVASLYAVVSILWGVFCYRVQTIVYGAKAQVWVLALNIIFCPISMLVAIKDVIPQPPVASYLCRPRKKV